MMKTMTKTTNISGIKRTSFANYSYRAVLVVKWHIVTDK